MESQVETHFKILGSFDPSVITSAIGMPATRQWRSGDRVGTSVVTLQDDGWRLTIGPSETLDATAQLHQLLEVVAPHFSELVAIRNSLNLDIIVTIRAYIVSDRALGVVPDLYLDGDVIRQLNTLGAEVDIDFVLLDDGQKAHCT